MIEYQYGDCNPAREESIRRLERETEDNERQRYTSNEREIAQVTKSGPKPTGDREVRDARV